MDVKSYHKLQYIGAAHLFPLLLHPVGRAVFVSTRMHSQWFELWITLAIRNHLPTAVLTHHIASHPALPTRPWALREGEAKTHNVMFNGQSHVWNFHVVFYRTFSETHRPPVRDGPPAVTGRPFALSLADRSGGLVTESGLHGAAHLAAPHPTTAAPRWTLSEWQTTITVTFDRQLGPN